MLHDSLKSVLTTGFREEDFEGFLPFMGMAATLVV